MFTYCKYDLEVTSNYLDITLSTYVEFRVQTYNYKYELVTSSSYL